MRQHIRHGLEKYRYNIYIYIFLTLDIASLTKPMRLTIKHLVIFYFSDSRETESCVDVKNWKNNARQKLNSSQKREI